MLCLPAPRTQAGAQQSVEERPSIADRNATILVGILNAQQEALIHIQKRRRIWNVALARSVLLTLTVSIVWWLFVGG